MLVKDHTFRVGFPIDRYDMVTSRVVAPIICVVATHIDESADQDDVSTKCRDIEEKLKQLEYGELETIRRHMDSLKSLMDKGTFVKQCNNGLFIFCQWICSPICQYRIH